MTLSTLMLIGGLGTPELIIILIVVLLLFGGKKIPELMKAMGQVSRVSRMGSMASTMPSTRP